MLLVPTSQLVVRLGSKILLEVWRQVYTDKRDQSSNLLFVAVDGVAAGVAGAVYPDE